MDNPWAASAPSAPPAPGPAQWLPPQTPTPPPPTEHPAFGAKRKRAGSGILAAIAAAAAKGKALLLLIPKVKFLGTAVTAVVSVAAYSLLYGWAFAAGFVALIFVHEMGHVVALRREGIRATAPMFIPFLGAFVAMKSLADDALAEARVGLAGPILGTVGAGVAYAIAESTNSGLWRALAYAGFLINLFNLIPVSPLDGGRAMAAMAPVMWFAGLIAMAALAIFARSPFMVLILLVGGMSVFTRWKAIRAGGAEVDSYYKVSRRGRTLVAITYIGLIVILGLGIHATYVARHL